MRTAKTLIRLGWFCHEAAHISYHDDPKILDIQVWSNSVYPYQIVPGHSDLGLHRLPFCPHLLDTLVYDKTTIVQT